MQSKTDFEIWNHSNQGGLSDSFTGTQGQDNIVGDTDSLETAQNTWVIVFNGSDYTGDSLQIDPSKKLNDLNHIDRHSSSGKKEGDWKNQIKSFVLYKSRPSYWGQVPSIDQLFLPSNGNALFTEDTDFLGNNRTFSAPYSAVNLQAIGYRTNSVHMFGTTGGTINSLRTGNNTWLSVFDDFNSNGCFLKVGPNQKHSDLNNVDRISGNGKVVGDWKNQIASFLLYDEKPEFWDTPYPRPYINFQSLYDKYPGVTNNESDGEITYKVEGSTYGIKKPELSIQTTTQSLDNYFIAEDFGVLPSSGWSKYKIECSHKNTGGRNDKALFDVYFDNAGKLVSIQHLEWSSNGAYEIPQQLITIVDDEAWVLGTAGAIESLGISEAAAEEFISTFDAICKVFNTVSSFVYQKTDNGGSYYLLPVICHTINRLCSVVSEGYPQQNFISESDSRKNAKFDFNYPGFSTALSGTGLEISNVDDWAVKQGSSDPLPFNQVCEYTLNDSHYRTWYQEASYSSELGMVISCKIDYEIDANKDDHIILMMGFRVPAEGQTTPILNYVQATIQFTDLSSDNIMTQLYTGESSVEQAFNELSAQLNRASNLSSYPGRQYLADVAKANMVAMQHCAQYLVS